MAEGSKKKSSKMTWNRLKNDPSISKNELPRIAKAFGITPPKGWDAKKTTKASTGKSRSRTEGTYKVKATKKAAPKKPTTLKRSKSSEGPVPARKTTVNRGRTKMERPGDAGPEQVRRKVVGEGGTWGQRKRGIAPLVRKRPKATPRPKRNVKGEKLTWGRRFRDRNRGR
jgi:hypothetical protein